jgi:hypothetical protein
LALQAGTAPGRTRDVVVFVLGLVTTSQWALGTAARTAAMFGTAEPTASGPTASGPLRLLPGDLPQGP